MDEQMNLNKTLQQGFDELQEHVVITDDKGTIVYANKAVEKTTGYKLDEIIGKNPGKLWGGRMPKEFYEKMWKIIHDEKQPFVAEVLNIKKDGTEFWQELHITPILNDNGEVKYFIGIEPDITDRKKKEEFRDEFFSIAKHQIMNPLTKNNIILDLLLAQESMEKKKEYIKQVYKDNLGIMTLINDLVFLSRMETQNLTRELIDLQSLIEETYTRLQAANTGVTFVFNKEGTDFKINSNAVLASQVFNNIIANAAEYSPIDSGVVVLTLRANETGCIFTCEDNGIGIPVDEQEKIFQKFYRATNATAYKSEGSGLGLYIVKTICEELGWEVTFTSELNQGTIFTLTIPK